MSTCSGCGTATPAGARFCPGCGAALAEARTTTQSLKTVTILFTDVVESTALGERFDPESLREVMQEYFDAVRTVVTGHGGSIEKFIGDAVMASFGVPALHDDDALRAVSAATQIHRSIDELSARLERRAGVTLRVRTGINTGEVLAEDVGESAGRLLGDPVNVAARLQQAAAPGEILMGPLTAHLVRDHVRSEELPPLVVKGRAAPVAAHLVQEVLPVEIPARPTKPIVGRAREIRLLRETLERVVEDRTPYLFTVLGPPGIGKSRLVEELRREGPALVLEGRCLAYGEGITYWPLAEIIRSAAGIETDDAPDAARAKLRESAADDAVTERVAQVASLSDAPGTTEEVFWGVRKYFEGLARQRPLVLVFDDIHWAEPTMLDLIDHLVDAVVDVPLLVVCMSRLELLEIRPTWGGGKMNATNLVLGPLREHECREMLGSLLGDASPVGEISGAVFGVAEGNPLFVEEMVSMLIDDGLLEAVDGKWKAVREVSSLSVPPTIHALVSARLDRLSLEEREVVGMAAVMGKEFVPRAVMDLAPASVGPRVDLTLDQLTRKQLVAPADAEFAGDRTYAFRHLLIRDTAYEHLPRTARATIHERYADWLVRILGNRIAEYDEIVGYHLEQAHLYQQRVGTLERARPELAERAAERLAEGGRRAMARQDAPAAIKLLTRAVDLLPAEDEKRLSVLPEFGLALYWGGEYDRSIAVHQEAIRIATSLGDVRIEARCRIFTELTRMQSDLQVNAEESRRIAERAIEVLTEAGDDLGLYYAWDLVAYIDDCLGRSEDALAALRRAGEHAERSGDISSVAAQKRILLRSLAWGSGSVAEILPLAEELLEWSRARHDRFSETRALLTLSQAHAMAGEFDVARSYVAKQKEVCSDYSLEFVNAWGAFEKAQVEVLAGDLDAAEAEARAACDFLLRKGEKGVLPTLQVQLADILYRKGLLDEAQSTAEAAKAGSTPDDSMTQTKWRAVVAKVLARRGELDEAVSLATEAAERGAETGHLDWYADILVDLAEVMSLVGRIEESAAAYSRAIELFARKGNVVAERATRQALRQTTSR